MYKFKIIIDYSSLESSFSVNHLVRILIQQVLKENDPEENDESEQEFEEPTKTIIHAEANATQLLLLPRIRDMTTKKIRNMIKQKKLTDFFKKQSLNRLFNYLSKLWSRD